MKIKLKDWNILPFNRNSNEKNNEDKENHESDYLEECIGAIGLWQLCISSAVVLTRYIALGNLTSIVFLTPITNFACIEFNNITAIAKNNTCYDNCTKYMYHSDAMETTLVSEFDLICKRAWLASLTQTILMLGVMIGVSFFGWLSDRHGRRLALISSTVINLMSMLPTPFISNYWSFTGLRFITGIASGGSLVVNVPIVMEVIGKRYREYAGSFAFIPDGVAVGSLSLYAYFLPTWNTYLLGFSIVCLFILVIICFVPESPRWLISRGKIDQAQGILIKAAKVNKLNTEHIRETVSRSIETMKIKENTATYLDFFKDNNMRNVTISSLVVWFVIGTTYYGIYQYMTLLPVNIYLTVAILGLIQVPQWPIQIVFTKLTSRRTSLATPLLIMGMAMIGLIFTPQGHWSGVVLGVVGFSASSFSYAIIYLYQAELFPTPLRNMSFGLASVFSKAGGMIAPFIAKLPPFWVPSLIFSIMSLVAVGFCFLLPETKNKNLKDTVD